MARLLRIAGILLALGSAAQPTAGVAQTAAPKGAPTPTVPAQASPTPAVPAQAAPKAADPQAAAPTAAAPQKPTPQWPKTLDMAKEAPPVLQWSESEIEAARAQCATLLADLDAVYVPAQPIREGDCGAPAPVELISIGRSPQVTLSQPAVVTCDMVAALSRWMKGSVQPAAKRHLGSQVIRLQVMSAYSCRNAYNRKRSRLSEHGRANALDVKGFLTERSLTVELASSWGLTARDIRAQVAAAEAARREAERVAAENAAKERLARSKGQPGKTEGGAGDAPPTAEPGLRGAIADGQAPVKVPTLPELGIGRREPQSFGLTPPARLGGPKPPAKEAAKAPPAAKDATKDSGKQGPADASAAHQAFLRQIHGEACKYFGTVLGPESNEAHRDHFHIDMAERPMGSFCE